MNGGLYRSAALPLGHEDRAPDPVREAQAHILREVAEGVKAVVGEIETGGSSRNLREMLDGLRQMHNDVMDRATAEAQSRALSGVFGERWSVPR